MAQLPAPDRKLHRIQVVQRLEGDLPDAAGEGVHQQARPGLNLLGQPVVVIEVPIAPFEEDPLIEENLHILGLKLHRAAQLLPDGARLTEEQRCILRQVVQQRAASGVEHRQVFVHRRQREAVPELGRIGEEVFLRRGGSLAPEFSSDGLELSGKLLRVPGEHLPGRGHQHPVHPVHPALGVGLEQGDGIDLVPPELHPVGIRGVGREEVEDAAPL